MMTYPKPPPLMMEKVHVWTVMGARVNVGRSSETPCHQVNWGVWLPVPAVKYCCYAQGDAVARASPRGWAEREKGAFNTHLWFLIISFNSGSSLAWIIWISLIQQVFTHIFSRPYGRLWGSWDVRGTENVDRSIQRRHVPQWVLW